MIHTPLTIPQIQAARDRAIDAGLPELHSLIHKLCDEMGVDIAALKGHAKRDPVVVAARAQVCLAASEAGFSQPQIGRVMHRDPTTVWYNIHKAKAARPVLMFISRRGNSLSEAVNP